MILNQEKNLLLLILLQKIRKLIFLLLVKLVHYLLKLKGLFMKNILLIAKMTKKFYLNKMV